MKIEDFKMKELQEELENYRNSDYYPFHMPGHKRNTDLMKMGNPYGIDITEIDGFDNLHLAEGILKDIMEETALIYGAKKSYLLVNGSTCGLLIGMAAATHHKDKVVIARNCHRAVYHGLYLNELEPVYLYPQEREEWGISGPILAEDVDKILNENPDAKLVVITSPTYEGIVSDIEAIAKVVHQRKIPLLVDEAHGAHFGFHSYFPQNSIQCGADIVIHSVHKTLPAFTQTALLHIQGNLVSAKRIEQFFSIYQSSSPSYILMAGIQKSIQLANTRLDLLEDWKENLEHFYQCSKEFSNIRVLEGEKKEKDPSKLIVSVRNTTMTGAELYQQLRDTYHLQMEAEYVDYIIAMTSMADTKEGFQRLLCALKEVDQEIQIVEHKKSKYSVLPKLKKARNPYEADQEIGVLRKIRESIGWISKEYVFLYPPGIPLIVPGEVISEEFVDTLDWYKENGLQIKGLSDDSKTNITVIGGTKNG